MSKKKRALVMDEYEAITKFVKDVLTLDGFEVEVASDGVIAVELFKEFKEILVILDLTKEDKEGTAAVETLQCLKEAGFDGASIVSSGWQFAKEITNPKEYGFNGSLPKPYLFEELRDIVKQVLEKAGA